MKPSQGCWLWLVGSVLLYSETVMPKPPKLTGNILRLWALQNCNKMCPHEGLVRLQGSCSLTTLLAQFGFWLFFLGLTAL